MFCCITHSFAIRKSYYFNVRNYWWIYEVNKYIKYEATLFASMRTGVFLFYEIRKVTLIEFAQVYRDDQIIGI